jgi:hypothetical protein
VPTNKGVALATTLGVIAIVATAVVHAVASRGPLAAGGALIPDAAHLLAREQIGDGGSLLLAAGALLALLYAFAGRYRDALQGRFGDWLLNGRVFTVLAVCLVALPLLLLAERRLTCAALAAASAVYLVARALVPRFFATTARAAAAGAGTLVVLAGALGADVIAERARQSNFDVAFVLPPEGGPNVVANRQVFADISRDLRLALKDADNVEVIPADLTEDDFRRYVITNNDALLGTKGRKGSPRVFIRIVYSLDPASGIRRISVRPYSHPAGAAPTIRLLDRWDRLPMAGAIASPVVSLKASFELITFLVSEGILRLDGAQQLQVWRNLFDEYVDALALARGDCAVTEERLAATRTLRARLDEAVLRQVLFTPCDKPAAAAPGANPAASAAITAAAPYADLMQP